MHLSFIIPAYNEGLRIGKSLEKAIAYFQEQDYTREIIVVDDGSADDTGQIVNDVAARHPESAIRLLSQPRNMGKGAAVRRGMLEARGDYRIFSDADFSTPVQETGRVLEHLRSHDVVIGSRAIDSSYIKEHQPWYRERMGKIFNLFVRMVAVRGIHDTQCGFKGFSAGAAMAVFARTRLDGFSFDVEALYIARQLGLTILEIPVEWHNDERTTLDPVRDSARMFAELLRIRKLHRGEHWGTGNEETQT